MIIEFTAAQCRLVASCIKNRPLSEYGKLANRLAYAVADAMDDEDEVQVDSTPVEIAGAYLLIDKIEGDIDSIRLDMKQRLITQIMAGVSVEPPAPTEEELADPDFVAPERQWNDWDDLAARVQSIQTLLDNKRAERIASGKAFLQSLR